MVMGPKGWQFGAAQGLERWPLPVLAFLCLVFAPALFVHVDAPFGISFLRLGASDLILPLLVGAALLESRGRGLRFWKLFPQSIFWGLVALSLVLTVGLLLGYREIGYFSQWALVNKYFGWFVLLGYFIVGASISGSGMKGAATLPFKMVFGGFFLTASISILGAVPGEAGLHVYSTVWEAGRLLGFLRNPNAMGLAAVVAMALLFPWMAQTKIPWKFSLSLVLFSLCFSALLLSGSRAALLAVIALFLAQPLFLRIQVVRYAWILAVAASLFFASIFCFPATSRLFSWGLFSGESASIYPDTERAKLDDAGRLALDLKEFPRQTEMHRSFVASLALEQFRESPWIGIGLGIFLERDRANQNERASRKDGTQFFPPVAIHNTSLWLLTELGVLGLAAFAGFFLYVAWRLWNLARSHEHNSRYHQMLLVLVVCIVASAGMDVLYLRPLWFLLGASLARSRDS